jgi:RNA polymerase sigma-70 factor (ECF subfamily)
MIRVALRSLVTRVSRFHETSWRSPWCVHVRVATHGLLPIQPTKRLPNVSPAAAASNHLADPFEALYLEHAAPIHRFCLSQTGNAFIAEELTHETFLRALAVDEGLRPSPTQLRPWLVRIARNLAVDHHRRQSRMRTLLARLRGSTTGGADVETIVEQRHDLHRINAALQSLRPRERELIGLRVAADLSYREIADLLGIAEAAAKVAAHRALNRLRTRLEEAP